ncbi:MAG: LTA synthase family protein, partial [Clostridia bacterium]|nr:LTA synthase family protein [Clostridia bacterium]
FIPERKESLIFLKNDLALSYKNHGVFLTTVTELWQMAFGAPEEKVENPYLDPSVNVGQSNPEVNPDTGVVYGNNTLNIDFETLISEAPNETIADMHRYFASVPATQQNKYTGMFEGKNLIFLSLEGWSYKVIDPELTPTLYKMFNEGFKFNNYYNIMWGSTASGEYANMTGNFYTQATCHDKSSSTLQYSAMGNMFRNHGYSTKAYHNHTYTYYKRHLAHPNFGYDYKGIGNGLVLETSCWPRSDLEMANATIGEYINSDKPFHTYYMTVSGHGSYSWTDNSMCRRHKDDIPEHYTYSEDVKSYIACQLEVELMLNNLIEELEDEGKLEDTVFAMAGDHYPYSLTDEELSELYGLPAENIRSNFELYHNSFILWSASMEEPIEVDTPCTSYDILPTLANLFGLNYESKVIIGKDILSSAEKIVIINDDGTGSSWNWITDKGQYNTATKVFTPSAECTMTSDEADEYVRITNLKVKAMRKYSHALLDNNYYSYLFNTDGTPKKIIE